MDVCFPLGKTDASRASGVPLPTESFSVWHGKVFRQARNNRVVICDCGIGVAETLYLAMDRFFLFTYANPSTLH